MPRLPVSVVVGETQHAASLQMGRLSRRRGMPRLYRKRLATGAETAATGESDDESGSEKRMRYSILCQTVARKVGVFLREKFCHVDFCLYFCSRFPRAEDARGEMPEWSIGAVSKTVDQLAGPRVRIPVSPQKRQEKDAKNSVLFVFSRRQGLFFEDKKNKKDKNKHWICPTGRRATVSAESFFLFFLSFLSSPPKKQDLFYLSFLSSKNHLAETSTTRPSEATVVSGKWAVACWSRRSGSW